MAPTVQLQELVIALGKRVNLASIMYTCTRTCLPFSLGLLKSGKKRAHGLSLRAVTFPHIENLNCEHIGPGRRRCRQSEHT
jgi:hypothetical protein